MGTPLKVEVEIDPWGLAYKYVKILSGTFASNVHDDVQWTKRKEQEHGNGM